MRFIHIIHIISSSYNVTATYREVVVSLQLWLILKAPLVLNFVRSHRWVTVHIRDMKTIPISSVFRQAIGPNARTKQFESEGD